MAWAKSLASILGLGPRVSGFRLGFRVPGFSLRVLGLGIRLFAQQRQATEYVQYHCAVT